MEHNFNQIVDNELIDTARQKRSYKKVTNEERLEVIDLVERHKCSYRTISRILDIKHDNVRAVYQRYLE